MLGTQSNLGPTAPTACRDPRAGGNGAGLDAYASAPRPFSVDTELQPHPMPDIRLRRQNLASTKKALGDIRRNLLSFAPLPG